MGCATRSVQTNKQLRWRDYVDVAVSAEVACIERHEMRNPMDTHDGDQAGVVNLDAGDTFLDDDGAPFGMSQLAVGRKAKLSFKKNGQAVRLGGN